MREGSLLRKSSNFLLCGKPSSLYFYPQHRYTSPLQLFHSTRQTFIECLPCAKQQVGLGGESRRKAFSLGLAQCPGEGRARLGRAAGHRRNSKEALSGVPAGAGVHPRGSPSLNCAPRAPHSSLGTEGRGTCSHRMSCRGDWRGSEVRPKAKAFVTLGTVFPLSPFLVSSLMGFSLKVSEKTHYLIVKEEREIHPYRAMKARGRSQAKSRVSSLCPAKLSVRRAC